MGTLLAKNADVLVTMDGRRRELRNAGLFARDGVIEQVGPTAELPEAADLALDLRGELALSGCTTAFDHADVFQNGCKVDDQFAERATNGGEEH